MLCSFQFCDPRIDVAGEFFVRSAHHDFLAESSLMDERD
jgi:hypothetical protein